MKRAASRGLLACALVFCAHAARSAATDLRETETDGHSPGSELRYRCSLPDGTTRMMAQDLSVMFAGTDTRCDAVQVEAAAPPVQAVPFPPLQTARRIVEIAQDPSPVVMTQRGRSTSGYAGPGEFEGLIRDVCRRHGVDPALVAALIYVESRFRADARSPKGALGLMQIMPATGARYGVALARSLMVPAVNVDVGTRYVRDLLEMFAGRLDLVIAAYNAGEGAVAKYGNRIPPFAETRDYVDNVMSLYNSPTWKRPQRPLEDHD